MTVKRMIAAIWAVTVSICCIAQESLSLEECRVLALKNNKTLEQAGINMDIAHYDRAIARANFFPNISANGSYLYNSLDLNLISDEQGAALRSAGTTLQGSISQKMEMLQQAIQSNPALAMEYMKSPMWQTVLGTLSQTDISQAVNAIGGTIDDLLHPDIHNVALVGASLQQPVFVGGRIIAANRIARLAEELSQSRYDAQYQQTIVDVDQAYWQIVSIAAKKKLAENYADFLKTMERDADILVQEGAYTASDQLAIKVKANEASMMLTQATNGLVLARMLLCKLIGKPLDSDIVLVDEGVQDIPVAGEHKVKSLDEIIGLRPELKSLDKAAMIYDQKVKMARADMMPQIAVSANYLLTNPNFRNGFQKQFGGFWTAGVVVKVPVFHGLEALKKTQKAKAEARLYHSKYEDAVELVSLEVSQLYAKRAEAVSCLEMATSNLDCAEENLRSAMIGFSEGVVESSVTLAAQSAWLKAHSERIDAGIELRMIDIHLDRAEGNIRYEYK
ncbi:MAG: TolC family protein [Bacteroidales bacterium]|nr:TolC family protein [Candidatus Cacconaster caballi]